MINPRGGIDNAEEFAKAVLALLAPALADPELPEDRALEETQSLAVPPDDKLVRAALLARLVILRAELARRNPTFDVVLELGASIHRLRKFNDEYAALARSRTGGARPGAGRKRIVSAEGVRALRASMATETRDGRPRWIFGKRSSPAWAELGRRLGISGAYAFNLSR